MKNQENKGEIIIYKADKGSEIGVDVREDMIWLSQEGISKLFQTDRSSVTKHLKNIIKSGELQEKSNVQNLHIANSDKPVKFYNLDFILSVGYRVNSKRATQFRIWATTKLREFLLKGYLEKPLKNEEDLKLSELDQAIAFLQEAKESQRLVGYEKELLNIITDYARTWVMLYKYDSGTFALNGKKTKVNYLDYDQVKKSIERFKARLMREKEASELFGQEVSEKLLSLLGNVKQAMGGKDVYPTLEEKAAHLLYFAVKNHPFVDGNKRIGALLFILFLVENHYLLNKKGERKINDAALTAITLLIAESKPAQKDVMIKLVVNLINKK